MCYSYVGIYWYCPYILYEKKTKEGARFQRLSTKTFWSRGDHLYHHNSHFCHYCTFVGLDLPQSLKMAPTVISGENWITTRKYKEMILDAAETVLGYFGFNRSLYGNKKNMGP
jgi:hypothetical protein